MSGLRGLRASSFSKTSIASTCFPASARLSASILIASLVSGVIELVLRETSRQHSFLRFPLPQGQRCLFLLMFLFENFLWFFIQTQPSQFDSMLVQRGLHTCFLNLRLIRPSMPRGTSTV